MGWLTKLGKVTSNVVRGTVSAGRTVVGTQLDFGRSILRSPLAPTVAGAAFGIPVPPGGMSNGGAYASGIPDLGQAVPLYGQGGGFAGFAKGGAGGGFWGTMKDLGVNVLGNVITNPSQSSGYGTGYTPNYQQSSETDIGDGTAAGAIIKQAGRKGLFPALPDDINSLVALRNAGFTLRAADLLHVPRSPVKGFVVVHPWNDARYIGMRRDLAVRMGLFRPGKKPIISVKQSNALRNANGAIKALKNANKMAKKVANFNPGGRKALPPPSKKGR